MRLTLTEHVAFPREEVFPFQRDRLGDVLDAMPGVASIEVLSREVDGARVRTVKRWTGAADALPDALRAALPATALQWRDEALWDQEGWSVDWANDLYVFPGAFVARGRNRFEADGDETIVHVGGEVAIAPERLPGGALLRPLVPTIERFLLAQIKGNLRALLAAVGERLATG